MHELEELFCKAIITKSPQAVWTDYTSAIFEYLYAVDKERVMDSAYVLRPTFVIKYNGRFYMKIEVHTTGLAARYVSVENIPENKIGSLVVYEP